MTVFVYGILALVAVGSGWWLFARRPVLSHTAGGAITASVVALTLVATAALLSVMVAAGIAGDGLTHAQRLVGLAARHLSVPLLGLAAWFLWRGLQWKPVIWSQIILGLMGGYELSRQLDMSLGYEWLVNGLGLGFLAWGCLGVRTRLMAALAVVAIGSLLGAAWMAEATPLAALFRLGPTASWLIPGLVACALAVGVLSDQAHNSRHSVDPDPDARPRS